ncbi:MAG: YciI-like protein [Prolixibacteraceae bacterium]|jgi:hypothetical protein|nr:YciI-like protein [Prolixibacteraceae bacterium]
MYYILFYETVDNYVEKRIPYREEHLSLAQQAYQNGSLIMGGALDDPADSAMLVFKGDNQQVAIEFAKNDPYVKNGLIMKWQVRPWNVVIGNK